MESINWEEVSMTMIANVGVAKSNAMNAIKAAREKEFEKAKTLLEEAEKSMIEAEKAHMEVIVQEANGIQLDFKVLYMHAEDQMLTTQAIIALGKEMIEMYKIIYKS